MVKSKSPVILKLFIPEVTNIATEKILIFYLVSFECEVEIPLPSDAEKRDISSWSGP
jgi:hypothetical protein